MRSKILSALIIISLIAAPSLASGQYAASVYTGLGDLADHLAFGIDNGEVVFEYCDASSELTDKYGSYPAWQAFDGDELTVWSEAASGAGVGETLYGSYSVSGGEWWVLGVAIRAGHHRNGTIFLKNNRPEEITASVNGREYTVTLADIMDWQTVLFDEPILAQEEYINLGVTINSVYSGSKYNDTCISSLDLIVAPTLSGYSNGGFSDPGDDARGRVGSDSDGAATVDMLMTEFDFFDLYPDYQPYDGFAVGGSVNDDGSWTWFDFLRTSDTITIYVFNCDSYVSLRKEASADSERLTRVPLNAEVVYYGGMVDWALCEYDGMHGWINTNYLSYQ